MSLVLNIYDFLVQSAAKLRCTRSDLGCRRTLKLRTPDEAILDFSYLNLAEHFYLCPAIQ